LALVCFHWVVLWSRIFGFCCLIITLSCAFAASPHPPTVVAQLTVGPAAALALPLYNSVAMLGGFFGPALMGWFVQHLGGFGAATAVMGGSMMLSGVLIWLLQHIMMRDGHTRAIAGGRVCGISTIASTGGGGSSSSAAQHAGGKLGGLKSAGGSGEAADGYEVVYRRSSSLMKHKAGTAEAGESELARLVKERHKASDAEA
jgi:hypothetical protein